MTCLLFGYSLLKFAIEMNEEFRGASVGLSWGRTWGTVEV
jgi:hypothetical protein